MEELDRLLKALEEGDTYADFVKQRILDLFVVINSFRL